MKWAGRWLMRSWRLEMPEPLNDKVGEYLFYEVLKGNMDAPPQIWLEVKDKNGNPVEIKLIKAKKEKK